MNLKDRICFITDGSDEEAVLTILKSGIRWIQYRGKGKTKKEMFDKASRLREITKDFYDLEYNQVLFIDDVNTVAEAAKSLNVPFIGIPAAFSWGFQREDMISTGVKYMLNSIRDIDKELLVQIDREAAAGTIWGDSERT